LVGFLGPGDQPVARPLPTQDSTTQKNSDISMPPAGFELTIPVFELLKTVHTSDRATIGTGFDLLTLHKEIIADGAKGFSPWKKKRINKISSESKDILTFAL
jgi:hypothetical protein